MRLFIYIMLHFFWGYSLYCLGYRVGSKAENKETRAIKEDKDVDRE